VLISVLVLVAGLAKLEHHPGDAFLELFVDVCMAMKLQGFKPQELSNLINGECASGTSCRRNVVVGSVACAGAGFAKLNHNPGDAFLGLFVDACAATRLQGFDPQALANIINGKQAGGPSGVFHLRGLCWCRLCEARPSSWESLPGAVRECLRDDEAAGLHPSTPRERDQR
jgi:hypothetical protein